MTLEDSQLGLILYLIWACRRQQISRYSIGRRKLEDVTLELFHDEKRIRRYLFSLKDRHYTKQNISYEALTGSSGEFSLTKYFKAYLKLKLESSVDYEIAVWTGARFRKKDSMVQQLLELCEDRCGMLDLLEGALAGVERYRVKSSDSLEENLLTSVHPLYKLAAKIARLLVGKLPIGPCNTSNESFWWLLENVFEENRFKGGFIAEHSTLPEETKQFRQYLETELHQHFQRKQIKNFQLTHVEQPPFSANVEITIKYDNVTSDSQKYCCNFQYTTTKEDVRRFLSSLAFYTNVPDSYKFNKVIHKQCNFNEEVCSELKRFFRRCVTLNENQINAIFELVEFGRTMRRRTNSDLQFTEESLAVLEDELDKFCTSKSAKLMILKAERSCQLTLNRIALVTEEFLTSRFILVEDPTKIDKLLNIFERLESAKNEFPNVIVPCRSDSNILSKIQSLTKYSQVILVVDVGYALKNAEGIICKDVITFDDFSYDTQDHLLSKSVILQGREFRLRSLLNDASLSNIPIEAVLDWNASEQILIGSGHVSKENFEYFIERVICNENSEKMNDFRNDFGGVTIIFGEPGIGKSTVLEKLAKDSQHEQCVLILFSCRNKNILFDPDEDVLNVLLKMLDMREADNFQNFLLKTLIKETHIHLLLDDFDEIDQLEVALEWIKRINLHSVVITAKPHLETFLKKQLSNSTVCYLKPFDEDDQLNFLRHRWKNDKNDEKQLKDALEIFASLFEDDFLRIPANLTIAAMLYEEICVEKDSESVAKIVEAFIDKKFKLFNDQYFNLSFRGHEIALNALRTSFEVDHAKLAFDLECGLNSDYDACKNLYQYGLLRIRGDKVSFVDRAFQEYFIAKFLLTHHVEQMYFNRLMKVVVTDFSSRLVEFLDYQLACIESIREVLGDSKPFIFPDYLLLRPNLKPKLNIDFSEGQLIDFIYSSITNNKFNIFEAFYDSLPIPLLNKISFKFSSLDTNLTTIDLSTLSEDKIVALLKILRKKHPNDIVRKIIANFTNDEPDFVTTSIVRGFKRLIEQLFCINESLTSAEEIETLQDYIEQRWKEYLKLVILNNQIEIVEIIVSCIAKKYHQRAIKGFLMEQNFLHVFAEACRKLDDGVLEIVQLVVEFVEGNVSDYDMSTIVKRKFNGSSFEELVENITSEKLRNVLKMLYEKVE